MQEPKSAYSTTYNKGLTPMERAYGYHKKPITKGTYGDYSKIGEEYEELVDAIEQQNLILVYCELADLYGALEAYANNINVDMESLKIMSDATKAAFRLGERC